MNLFIRIRNEKMNKLVFIKKLYMIAKQKGEKIFVFTKKTKF